MSEIQSTSGISYLVDPNWRILDAFGPWVSASKDQTSRDVCASIVGSKLTDHISGIYPRMLTCCLVSDVQRHRRKVSVPYRADTSTVRRHCTMTVEPVAFNRLLFAHRLESQRETGSMVVIRHTRTARTRHCFNCNALNSGMGWFDPFDIDGPMIYAALQDVCPSCEALFKPQLCSSVRLKSWAGATEALHA